MIARGLGDGACSSMPATPANIDLCSGAMYYLFPPCWCTTKATWNAFASYPPNLVGTDVNAATNPLQGSGANLTPGQLAGTAPIDSQQVANSSMKSFQASILAGSQGIPEDNPCTDTGILTKLAKVMGLACDPNADGCDYDKCIPSWFQWVIVGGIGLAVVKVYKVI